LRGQFDEAFMRSTAPDCGRRSRRQWLCESGSQILGADSRGCSQAAEHIAQIPELSLPYPLPSSRKTARGRVSGLPTFQSRFGIGNGNHDEVASRVVVVGAVPKWHSAAAPPDELRM
jgi:hypothetical protein